VVPSLDLTQAAIRPSLMVGHTEAGHLDKKSPNRTLISPKNSLFLGLKLRPREFRPANDASERAAPEGIVKRNRNGYRRCLQALLHDLMATSLPHGDESVLLEDATNLGARQNSKPYPTGTST
jgi:hypothetical protein